MKFLYRHPTLDRVLEGDPAVLVKDGRVQQHRLQRELITQAQLEAAARRQGIEHLHEVKVCRLETGGALTFVAREPTADDHRHRALVDRLDAIETQLARLCPPATPAASTAELRPSS